MPILRAKRVREGYIFNAYRLSEISAAGFMRLNSGQICSIQSFMVAAISPAKNELTIINTRAMPILMCILHLKAIPIKTPAAREKSVPISAVAKESPKRFPKSSFKITVR